MFEAGPEGFEGGLSAKNYMTITGVPAATATRDLRSRRSKRADTNRRTSTRYHLTVELHSVSHVTADDLGG